MKMITYEVTNSWDIRKDFGTDKAKAIAFYNEIKDGIRKINGHPMLWVMEVTYEKGKGWHSESIEI